MLTETFLGSNPLAELPHSWVVTGGFVAALVFGGVGISLLRQLMRLRHEGQNIKLARCATGASFLMGSVLWMGFGEFGSFALFAGTLAILLGGFFAGLGMCFPHGSQSRSESADATSFGELSERLDETVIRKLNHEFRTPLTTVMGYLDLMINDGEFLREGGQRMETLQTMRLNTQRVITLVENLTELLNRTFDSPTFALVDVQTGEFVENVLREQYLQSQVSQLAVNLKVSEGVPGQVRLALHPVEMILKAIFLNALQFSKEGSIDVHVDFMPGEKKVGQLSVMIRDHGIGMSPQLLAQIREGVPFATVNGRSSGLGIGLWLSRKLVNQLDGTFDIQSALGTGTTVTVRFDVAVGTPTDPKFVPALASPNGSVSGTHLLHGQRLLVIEEDTVDRNLLYSSLKQAEAKVEIAENSIAGKKLLAGAFAEQQPYQLVLVGVPLHHNSLSELLKDLREIDRKVPILAISDQHTKEDWRESLCVGFDDYLAKPVDQKTLVELCSVWSRKSGTPPLLSS